MTFGHGLVVLALLPSAFAQEGALIDLGTHKLNLVCTGAADARPVVILEAGGGGTSAAWKSVQEALPKTVRSCAYDRAGSGKSDSVPAPRSMDAEVDDLAALLKAAQITQPIVYVGHSLGGILARLFAEKYPRSLAAVVLLDPTDENDIVFNTKVNRWLPVVELEGPLGDGARQVAKARQANPATFGNRPLVVIGAGNRTQPPGTSPEQWQQMRSARDERVKRLSLLSRTSKFILDPRSSHNIPHDNPKLVAETIQDVLRQNDNFKAN